MNFKKFFISKYKNEEVSFRKEFYEIAFNYLRYNNLMSGVYLEFGVYSGTTFNLAIDILDWQPEISLDRGLELFIDNLDF